MLQSTNLQIPGFNLYFDGIHSTSGTARMVVYVSTALTAAQWLDLQRKDISIVALTLCLHSTISGLSCLLTLTASRNPKQSPANLKDSQESLEYGARPYRKARK